jgi:hypothetical protein
MFTEQGHTKHISPVNGDVFFRAAHAAPGGAHDISLCLIFKHPAPTALNPTVCRDFLIKKKA